MLETALLLAQTDLAKAVEADRFSANTRVKLILIAALLLATSLALILALALRKRRPGHRSRHYPSREAAQAMAPDPAARAFPGRHREKRRRREHRRRNPTLAETGGLPPLRRDDATQTPSQP